LRQQPRNICAIICLLTLTLAACGTAAPAVNPVSETQALTQPPGTITQNARSYDFALDSEKLIFKTILHGQDYSIPYRLYLPQPSDARTPLPVVLYLHGYGSRGRTMSSMSNETYKF